MDCSRVVKWPLHCRCGIILQSDGSWASRGLGDTVAKITAAVGIKPCGGCKERQAKLNRVLPYQ